MKCLKISLIAFLWAGVHATRHEVKVGQNGLTFEPETVNAVPGDTVTYSFYAKVREASPCLVCRLFHRSHDSRIIPLRSHPSTSHANTRRVVSSRDLCLRLTAAIRH